MLAVAVGGAAGQGQRQGVFAGGQKPRQREFVRRPKGHARRLAVDSQLGHLLPGQGQQRRGGLQLRCCDLQCGAVGLGEMGRVLVRVSGTEPKIRVMVEGEDQEAIKSSADRIADMIKQRILNK